MKKAFVSLALSFLGCKPGVEDSADTLITNPDVSSVGAKTALTASVALGRKGKNGLFSMFCSGTLVRDHVVITAAHCLESWKAAKSDHDKFFLTPEEPMYVAFGDNVEQAGVVALPVSRYFFHPKYPNTRGLTDDVALVRFEGQRPASSRSAAINTQEVTKGTLVRIAGYGWSYGSIKKDSKGVERTYNNPLTKVDLGKYASMKVKLTEKSTDDNFHVVDARYDGNVLCHGDSGGGSFLESKLLEGSLVVVSTTMLYTESSPLRRGAIHEMYGKCPKLVGGYSYLVVSALSAYPWLNRMADNFERADGSWKCRLQKPVGFPFGDAPCRSEPKVDGLLWKANVVQWLKFGDDAAFLPLQAKPEFVPSHMQNSCWIEQKTINCLVQ